MIKLLHDVRRLGTAFYIYRLVQHEWRECESIDQVADWKLKVLRGRGGNLRTRVYDFEVRGNAELREIIFVKKWLHIKENTRIRNQLFVNRLDCWEISVNVYREKFKLDYQVKVELQMGKILTLRRPKALCGHPPTQRREVEIQLSVTIIPLVSIH